MAGLSDAAELHMTRAAATARERVLVVRIAGLGDVVMASTIVTRIRVERPLAHVTWLTGEAARPLVELFGVDEIVTVDERRLLGTSVAARAAGLASVWRKLAGRKFDIVALAHADSRYRLLLRSARVGELRMLRRFEHGAMNPIPGRFLGDEYARLLDDAGSRGPIQRRYEIVDVRPRLGLADSMDDEPLVVLVPGGARNVLRDDPLRRWPLERYAAVAERLLANYPVAIIGDAGDAWVRDAFASLPVRDLVASLALQDTLRLLARASLVISHDTGPIHLARLVRAPLLALFGPTSPRHFLGEPDGVTALWGGAGLACRPCYDGREYAPCANNLCMKDISVDRVVECAVAMLATRRTVTA